MAGTAARKLGTQIRAALVVSSSAASLPQPFETIVGGHPTPTKESERAGRQALALAESVAAGDILLVLLSGGASALMAVPADGLTLDDKREATKCLLSSGADIHGLNTVRKHLSAIKGGRLAAATPGRCVAYAVSDVVGDHVSVIASGPTVPDPTTYANAVGVLRQYGGVHAYPSAVVAHLQRGIAGAIEETPKLGDARLNRATTTVIGDRRDAMAGAAEEAVRLGYRSIVLEEPVTGEARDVASSYLQRVLAAAGGSTRTCVISSGETTVKVRGRGKGGRNQEFALALAAHVLAIGHAVSVASVGTDGVDGPSDAAGAIVDSTTLVRAREEGLDEPQTFLNDNNAYAFFSALGDLIRTGPTGTNVGDLQVILIA